MQQNYGETGALPVRIGGAEARKRQAPNGLPGAAAGRKPGRRLRHRGTEKEAFCAMLDRAART